LYIFHKKGENRGERQERQAGLTNEALAVIIPPLKQLLLSDFKFEE
jgi:hypothetical protein